MAPPNALARVLLLVLTLTMTGHYVQAQNQYAQQESLVIRVLLKPEATSLFYINRKAWVAKVEALIESGHGNAKSSTASDFPRPSSSQLPTAIRRTRSSRTPN